MVISKILRIVLNLLITKKEKHALIIDYEKVSTYLL